MAGNLTVRCRNLTLLCNLKGIAGLPTIPIHHQVLQQPYQGRGLSQRCRRMLYLWKYVSAESGQGANYNPMSGITWLRKYV